jgi:hypothetical protein
MNSSSSSNQDVTGAKQFKMTASKLHAILEMVAHQTRVEMVCVRQKHLKSLATHHEYINNSDYFRGGALV